jgi:hypothetical protein
LKYISNKEGEKLLPCFSFCPLPAYKTSDWNSSYTKQGYKENTFRLHDIFSARLTSMLMNTTEYSVTETESILMGVCQTICKLKKVKAFDYEFSFELKRDWNMNVFFHAKGSEFLFLYSAVSLSSQLVTLNSKRNIDDIIALDLSINEIKTTLAPKEHFNCKLYYFNAEKHNSNEEYMKCLKTEFWSALKPKINCSIGGMFALFHKGHEINDIDECKDFESAVTTRETVGRIISTLLENTSAYNCPPPCQIVSYHLNSISYHKNSLLKNYYSQNNEDYFLMTIYYNTLVIEERTETLLYDATGMLASAGGNLGLMLGFSCLSLLFLAVDCIKNLCVNRGLAIKICAKQNAQKR